MRILMLLPLAILASCGTLSLRAEYEHISHPTTTDEDVLDQASLLLRTELDGWYAEGGAGIKLDGRNGGGFRGPALTGSIRFGREFRLYRFKR